MEHEHLEGKSSTAGDEGWSNFPEFAGNKKENEYKNDDDEDKRAKQLGLEDDPMFSDLTEEEKRFLELPDYERSFINESCFLYYDNRDINPVAADRRKYINAFMMWYDTMNCVETTESVGVSDSMKPQKRLVDKDRRLALALTDAILNLDIPDGDIKKTMLLMAGEGVPNAVKEMIFFKMQHPIGRLKDEFRSPSESGERMLWVSKSSSGTYPRKNADRDVSTVQSPILSSMIFDEKSYKGENGISYDTEKIIYSDLLKCAFGSGGKNLEKAFDSLLDGENTMREILSLNDDDEKIGNVLKDEKSLYNVHNLVRQLHSLHYQTKTGQREEYDTSLHNSYSVMSHKNRTVSEVKKEIEKIIEEYKPTKRYTLSDRVVRSFCWPLGIKNMPEAYEYLENKRFNAYIKHRQDIKNGLIGKIEKGDFVKGVPSVEFLPYILENGVLAKEYLGVGASSDCTPLDTDVSEIENDSGDLKDAISGVVADRFGRDGVFLVFKNDGRFGSGRRGNDLDLRQYELFNNSRGLFDKDDDSYGVHSDERGVRTGIAATDIDYIVTGSERIEETIKMVEDSGIYIPVVDIKGRVLY